MIFVYNLARMRKYIIIVDLVPVPQSLGHVRFCNVFGIYFIIPNGGKFKFQVVSAVRYY